MCFSATASFSAGIVLAVIGVASIKKIQHRSQTMFALIPFIFAIQQFSEGLLWLSIPNEKWSCLQTSITYFYLIIAQIIWAVWVPVAILLLEKEQTRKQMQRILVAIGMFVSMYLTYCLFHFSIRSEIDCYHIAYIQTYPEDFRVMGGLLYIIATILPPFFSHIRRMWWLGVMVLISYIVTTVFYESYLVSVWCFFASVISLSVYLILSEIKISHREEIYLKRAVGRN
ncbi:hypothetical protein DMB65_12475 [Flavobacterium cheongpyeongense]|uniref:Histidine kinase N-terminal 7TM region domain-containing protein n=1 Tax=Flavobacterium cheongpyeongense TaxID=2212651 RepID=A0A2V4BNJ0_9FLAO|nr:DUF6629 family protein [Flavobacterium cheongpyeongense]PXY40421.1 hypothetical protein DMB65_12475 [Flavobacterium cheongpyeongense]